MSFKDWYEFRKKIDEGFGPYIGPCIDTPNYQVMGACSNYNTEKKNRSIRQGNVGHKKKKSLH